MFVWSSLVACAENSPRYEPTGTWSFAGFRTDPGPRCDDAFLALLEQDVTLDGAFAEYDSGKTSQIDLGMLGATASLDVSAPDSSNVPFGFPKDDTAVFVAEDGTSWQPLLVMFDTDGSCGECEDGVSVELDLKDSTCAPVPQYR